MSEGRVVSLYPRCLRVDHVVAAVLTCEKKVKPRELKVKAGALRGRTVGQGWGDCRRLHQNISGKTSDSSLNRERRELRDQPLRAPDRVSCQRKQP